MRIFDINQQIINSVSYCTVLTLPLPLKCSHWFAVDRVRKNL